MDNMTKQTLERIRTLLADAADAANDADMDGEGEGSPSLMAEINSAVLTALQGTWLKDILPHCPKCAAPDPDCASFCGTCGAVLA